jgi:HAD superfamily hydrolase (TIGR01509 family)
MLDRIDAIVWDYDGVVNRNYDARGFMWSHALEADHGLKPGELGRALFSEGMFREIIAGRADIHAELERILPELGCATPAEDLVRYWYERDSYLCADVLAMIAEARALGVTCVLGTNSDPHRIAFLREASGLADHLDHLLGSGIIGHAKPEPAFYAGMAAELGLSDPSRILLVDDMPENIEGAKAAGWQAILYGDFTRLTLGEPAELRRALGLASS